MVYPGNVSMTPVGIMMIEHRLIERMISLLKKELGDIQDSKKADPVFIDTAIDFIRIYADKCHHGKEEDIFFKVLLEKKLKSNDNEYILELIEEHKQGRAAVGRLDKAKEGYIKKETEALNEIADCLKWLIEFYPRHIEKEDGHFFNLYKTYLNEEEQDKMLVDFSQFSKESIHDKYSAVVEKLEKEKKIN
jgi:hemerythrin-like domain-containing protein